MNERILLVEDDRSLRETTRLILESTGMHVDTENDGQTALSRLERDTYDLLLLDIMLPVVDGLDVLRTVRKGSTMPIVMLTARATTTDLVVGLELGADDYVTKPFAAEVLIARIRAVLRRIHVDDRQTSLSRGSLVIDPRAYRASNNGILLDLSTTDFKLLYELARHVDHVLTRDVLLERVWQYDYRGDSRLVDMAILRLRSKIEDDPAEPKFIVTVRGIGYRFECP